jgi:hypothetical protein
MNGASRRSRVCGNLRLPIAITMCKTRLRDRDSFMKENQVHISGYHPKEGKARKGQGRGKPRKGLAKVVALKAAARVPYYDLVGPAAQADI